MTDVNRIQPRHDVINFRLEEWARWVRPGNHKWCMQPMFRMYQSKARHWEISPAIKIEINIIAAHEIEKAVSFLPGKNRTAVRWFYVFPFIHINIVHRHLGVTDDALLCLLDDGRDMLKNRLTSSPP